MKILMDLKNDILNENFDNLYIFIGVENLIRKRYCEKIAESKGTIKYIDSVKNLFKEIQKKNLFNVDYTYIVYNDLDFLKQREKTYRRLIELSNNRTIILLYDDIEKNNDFKNYFEDYITKFNYVTDDIANKYVIKHCKGFQLNDDWVKDITFNCFNSYNNIVEEMNKFTNYKEATDDSIDSLIYSTIFNKRVEIPEPKLFANAFIIRDLDLLSKCYNAIINENILSYLPELYNTVLLAIYLKNYGKWDGGSKAYNSGEYWGRIKELRDYNIPYTKEELLDIRYLIFNLDLDLRTGKMKPEHSWNYLLGVIL